jgi:hypothetical protein
MLIDTGLTLKPGEANENTPLPGQDREEFTADEQKRLSNATPKRRYG